MQFYNNAGSINFLVHFVCVHNRLKNLSTAVNATKRATSILLKKVNQTKNFFAKKMPDLAPVLNKLMQLKRVADEHSHEIFSDCKREPGDGAPSR